MIRLPKNILCLFFNRLFFCSYSEWRWVTRSELGKRFDTLGNKKPSCR